MGITRAKDALHLTSAAQRMLFGRTNYNAQSKFIAEIPQDLCEVTDQTIRNTSQIAIKPQEKVAVHNSGKDIGINMAKPEKTSVSYNAGDRVSHKIFGNGTIISTKPMGNDSLLEIDFGEKGTKRIMANFAKLSTSHGLV